MATAAAPPPSRTSICAGGERGGELELLNSPNTPPAEGEEEHTEASDKDEAEVRMMSPVPLFLCVLFCSNGSIVGKGATMHVLFCYIGQMSVCVCVCVCACIAASYCIVNFV